MVGSFVVNGFRTKNCGGRRPAQRTNVVGAVRNECCQGVFIILIIIFDFSVVIVSFTYSLKMNSRYLLHYIRYLVRTRR